MESASMLPGWNYLVRLRDDEDGWVVVLRASFATSTNDPLRPVKITDSARWESDPEPDPEKAFFAALEIARKLDGDHRMAMRNAVKDERDRWRRPQAVAA